LTNAHVLLRVSQDAIPSRIQVQNAHVADITHSSTMMKINTYYFSMALLVSAGHD
jgi:hypothetical protein